VFDPNAPNSCVFLFGKLYAQDAQYYGSRVYQIAVSVSGIDSNGNSLTQIVTGITITVPTNSTAAGAFPYGCSTGNCYSNYICTTG
jgi:hypothetical protein